MAELNNGGSLENQLSQLLEFCFSEEQTEEALDDFIASYYLDIFTRLSPEMSQSAKIQLLVEMNSGANSLENLARTIWNEKPEDYENFKRQGNGEALPLFTEKDRPPAREAKEPPQSQFACQIVPQKINSGRHVWVVIKNTGDLSETFRLKAKPDSKLVFTPEQNKKVIEPDRAGTFKVKITSKRAWFEGKTGRVFSFQIRSTECSGQVEREDRLTWAILAIVITGLLFLCGIIFGILKDQLQFDDPVARLQQTAAAEATIQAEATQLEEMVQEEINTSLTAQATSQVADAALTAEVAAAEIETAAEVATAEFVAAEAEMTATAAEETAATETVMAATAMAEVAATQTTTAATAIAVAAATQTASAVTATAEAEESRARISFSQSNYNVDAEEGVAEVVVLIERREHDDETFWVDYRIEDDTAESPDDYTAPKDSRGRILFLGNEDEVTIQIIINKDISEPKRFLLTLLNPEPEDIATIGPIDEASVTIFGSGG